MAKDNIKSINFGELDEAVVVVMERIRQVCHDDISETDRENLGSVLMNLNTARVQISRACNRVQIQVCD